MRRPPQPRVRRYPKGTPSLPPLPSPLTIAKALGIYAAFLFFSYTFSSAAWRCPMDLDCYKGIQGYFWDASQGMSSSKGSSSRTSRDSQRKGHLLERDVGVGVLASEECSKLCQDIPDCAYWMYTKTKKTGPCRLWAVDQSPCKPLSAFRILFPFATVRFTNRGKLARASTVGGACREEEASEGGILPPPQKAERIQLHGDISDLDLTGIETTECPHLECAVPTKGFLFDHKDKGHLRSLPLKIRKRRGYNCYQHCRDTPGCSVWMVDEKDDDGECRMWTKEQSPCEPTDPYDASTAHYVKPIPGRHFLIGGNCHKLPPRPPRQDK